jgi:hypothetical protein
MGKVALSALLFVGLLGCATLAERFEAVRNECRTWVTAWRPEIGYEGVPVAVLPFDKRLDACMASRVPRFQGSLYEYVPTQYQCRMRFDVSGDVQLLYVWLVNSPGDPLVGTYSIMGYVEACCYGDFRAIFEGNAYRGALEDASDGQKCEVRGNANAERTHLTGRFTCSRWGAGTLDLRTGRLDLFQPM